MDKTINYQLNQWAAEDRVLRTDFNADNQKIDAAIRAVDKKADGLSGSKADQSALAALASRTALLEDTAKLHTIKTLSSPKTSSNVFIPLNDIDWTQWKVVIVCIHAEMDSGTCRLYPRGSVHDNDAITYSNYFQAVLFPLYRDDLLFSGIMLANSGTVFSFGAPYRTARGFELSPLSSQTILGVSVTVYGIK